MTADCANYRQVSRRADYATTNLVAHYRHNVIVEAIVESALVNWIGLVLYGITSLAPQGRITVRDIHGWRY